MNRRTTGSLYHAMPETGATKMSFDKKFCGFFDYLVSYFFIKVFVI